MMFHLEESDLKAPFLDDDDSVTIMTNNDLEQFDTEMDAMGLVLEPRSGGILSIHPVMEHEANPYDPFRLHMLQSNEMLLDSDQEGEVNRIQGSEMKFQVDNGSATMTTPFLHLVAGYTPYPLKKIPTFTSATQHTIQSHGKGGIQFGTNSNEHEKFVTKFTPGIAHNIVSPAQHIEDNKDKYWGYMIGLDRHDYSSVLVFKSIKVQSQIDQNLNYQCRKLLLKKISPSAHIITVFLFFCETNYMKLT